VVGASTSATAPAPMPTRGPAAVAEKVKPSADFSNRGGYKPGFIEGFSVPLPSLPTFMERDAARNREAEPGDDPFELKYYHFSIVMNKRRKLAFFTACNIDGSQAKAIDRSTGAVSPLDPDSKELESLADAESSDSWYLDGRLRNEDYAGKELYEGQKVPGFADTRALARIHRLFQRGHLVRRIDPAWGKDSVALKAEADTFHFTNCTPQVGFFNMGTAAKLRIPHTGGGRLWRSVENYILRNATAERLRICSFTGPVFDDNDLDWRTDVVPGFKVPLRFWKIAVWPQEGRLRSLAMIADQGPMLEAIGKLPEALSDAEVFTELSRVKDFLSSIAEIETLTGLNFGIDVRKADIRSGKSVREVSQNEDIDADLASRAAGAKRARAAVQRQSRKTHRKR
jgi:endonuclease G, mitochondrial